MWPLHLAAISDLRLSTNSRHCAISGFFKVVFFKETHKNLEFDNEKITQWTIAASHFKMADRWIKYKRKKNLQIFGH